MEKLQAALKLAREQRAETAARSSGAVDGVATPVPGGVPDGNQDPWRHLTAFLPDPKQLFDNRVVTLKSSNQYPGFDMLQTKIALNMEKEGWRRLAITSPTTSCGKTTIVANLAIGFLRQTDKRIIVYEMDMRRPALAATLGIEPEANVSDVLEGRLRLQDQAVRIGSNVILSVNAKPAKNPANLFMRDQTADVLDRIEEQFAPDLVVFDMPPMLVNDDATAFLKNVDCALLVAAAGVSSVEEVDICEREISSLTQVLGTVLNKCEYSEEAYGYGYGYGQPYGEA